MSPEKIASTITFKTEESHCAFHSMAEGMWDVARDDNVSATGEAGARAALLELAINTTPYTEGMAYPATFQLSAEVTEITRDVIENMNDNEEDDETANIELS